MTPALRLLPLVFSLLVAWTAGTASAIPNQVILSRMPHEYQRRDNCGPVTALTVLGHYGVPLTQAQAEKALKDSPTDPQVSTSELGRYLAGRGLSVVVRFGGSPQLIRELVAAGYPVVVQQRLSAGSNVAHFRTVYGYQGRNFLTSDPFHGPKLWLTEAEFVRLWHYYNGEYLVAVPPAQQPAVARLLGADADRVSNLRRLAAVASQGIKNSPGDPYWLWGLGTAALHLGDPRAATGYFDRAVAAGVPLVYFLYRQEAFEAWNQSGQYSKTLTWATRALPYDRSSKELLGAAAQARRGLGQ